MPQFYIISVDFQKDFTDPKGFAYRPRSSVDFVKEVFVPFLRTHGIKISEIISDYREIPLSKRGFFCQPGTFGFESEIPHDVKTGNTWIKCQHSPVWTRESIGVAKKPPGKPFADPNKFRAWLESEVGDPSEENTIVLVGLTVNCCVLSVAQELFFRGYKVMILKEATDDYSGNVEDKENAMRLIDVNHWAESISWGELKQLLENAPR